MTTFRTILTALVLFGAGTAAIAAGDRFYFKAIGVEEGLSQNTVYDLLQDKQGFIWVATQNGLNRFDGSSFKVFQGEAGAAKGLTSDAIFSLSEDLDGNIWVGTLNGVNIYDAARESFSPMDLVLPSGTPVSGIVRDMALDRDGNVFVVIADSCVFQAGHAEKEASLFYTAPKGSEIRSICTDPEGNLWLATWRAGLLCLHPDDGTTEQFLYDGGSGTTGQDFTRLFLLDNETLLTGTVSGGVLSFNIRTHTFTPVKGLSGREARFVHDICRDGKSRIWVGTEDGLHVWDGKETLHLRHVPGDPYSISDNAVYTVLRDREDGMWVGSYFGGVNYYSSYSSQFDKFFPIPGEGGLKGKNISEFCENGDGRIWVGTEDAGLHLFDPADQSFTSGFVPAKNIHALSMLDGKLWIGSWSAGLFVLDPATGRTRSYLGSDAEGALHDNSVYSIYRDDQGLTWIGTEHGLYLYHSTTDSFEQVNARDMDTQVNAIRQDFSGRIWFATLGGGLFSYDKEEDRWTRYPLDGSAGSIMVTCILEDRNHDLWFGSEGSGLFFYNHQSQEFTKHFTEEDGLPNSVIYKLIEDWDGAVWGTTNHGIFRLDPRSGGIRIYRSRDGLLCDQYNYSSGMLSKDGTLYFGGVKGFVSFRPSQLQEPFASSSLVFTQLLIFNEEAEIGGGKGSPLERSVSQTGHIVLKPSQSVFTVGFTDLSFSSSNVYQYRLRGFEEEWIDMPSPHPVTYSKLRPGKYSFQVRALRADHENPIGLRTLDIQVQPPFYRTRIALILYVFLLLSAILLSAYLILRYYRNRNMAILTDMERRKEKELLDSKIDFFTNITHEIRTPLTLITVPLEEIIQRTPEDSETFEDLTTIRRNCERLLKLANELLDFKRIGSKELVLNFVQADIGEMVETIVSRFRSWSGVQALNLSVSLPQDPVRADVDPEIVDKILSNLLSNACKHAASAVEVTLTPLSGRFRITVSNDGDRIPISQAERIFDPFVKLNSSSSGSGIGLPFARMLAESHGGRLFLDTVKENATFVVDLPLVQETSISLSETEGEAIPDEVPGDEARAAKRDHTLLLVEDNEEFLRFLSRQLSTEYRILTATNGQEALDLLTAAKEDVDLIISDLMMPVMDGMELCSRIKNSLEFSHIPVILLTAKTDLQTKIESMKIGADEYISKPFSSDFLHVRIRNLLQMMEKYRNAFYHTPEVPVETIAHTPVDETFVKDLTDFIYAHMDNPDLDVEDLADAMGMSRSSLYRKMKAMTDLSPNDFIRLFRLKKAATLLGEGDYKVNEIAYIVGFATPSYFSKCFLKQFGVLPKDFVKAH